MELIEKYNLSNLTNSEKRSLILNILYTLELTDYEETAEEVLDSYSKNFNIVLDENEFSKIKILYTIKNINIKKKELDRNILDYLDKWTLDRVSVINKLILRYAVWEILDEKVDAPLVINEAIELAKGYAESESYRFINGILDSFVKRKNNN